ncbi:ABC transporter permease [Chthonobacter rhizosphaerae]|uniref:ABC transporter permease n=1 Tax=Chthonobacter rhizosphaerae TaxID=2735553 RepID=UPI0015EEB056|nr:ABC transporter permease [Chthonobacter rhizosphaerae]
MLSESVLLALRAIRRNILRSFLTVLGVVIGVAAVIAMVTIGNGATVRIQSELGSLGNNLLFIQPGQGGPGAPSGEARLFTVADAEAIRQQVGGVAAVAPVSRASATVVYGSESRATTVVGSTSDYLVTQGWDIALGRGFLDGEVRGGRSVCVIGETVRRELFGAADPVGASIRVRTVSCPIVGVLAAKGQSAGGADQDDTVIMPLRAVQRRLSGTTTVATILISAEDGVDTARVQAATTELLRERRGVQPGEKDDFAVRDMRQIVQTMTATTGVLTGLLGAVAAVSLVVGGIGIMNIMLVSVTERTREIGIRLAIGALEHQVLTQFLVEAVMLSLFGGLVGILLGLGLAFAASQLLAVPFVVDPGVVAGAFVFSAFVGIAFGYFPARSAARLDPIEALRRE